MEDSIPKNLNELYLDVLSTPALWHQGDVFELRQLKLNTNTSKFTDSIPKKLRLGKLVELFIIHELKNNNHVMLLDNNIQIRHENTTIGELDCLFLKNRKPIHLEIIYKFYLYDGSIGRFEIDRWVGPNRKDSLVEKLNKLKQKQLPLLYSEYTKPVLNSFNLHVKDVDQMVCFKAQLFVPYSQASVNFKDLNEDCVRGFYITKDQLNNFRNHLFYMPKKIDWLLEVTSNASWINFFEATPIINHFLNENKSPLCWIKAPNSNLQKCFVVWW